MPVFHLLRADNDWWMHVSGCPGSHVVIRSASDDLVKEFPETTKDAALLAAVHSKAGAGGGAGGSSAGRVTVTLTRCKHVSKVAGSPAGQVSLAARHTQSVAVDIKREQARLQRLRGEI